MKNRFIKLVKDFYVELTVGAQTGKRLLGVAYRVRKKGVILYLAGAIVETFGSIFTIYATAQLFARIAEFASAGGSTDQIWFWLFMDTFAAALIGLGFWIMQYAGRLVYFSLNQWTVYAFMEALCRIDINDFYISEVRDEINKIHDNYTWQIPNLVYSYLELIYAFMRFIAIAIVVSQISFWLILIIGLFLIPTLLSEGRIAKIQWLIWGDKGDNRHVFYGIDRLMTDARPQMEIRSTQTTKYLLNKIRSINFDFYKTQETQFKKASRFSLSAKVLEIGGVLIGAVVLLKQFLSGAISLDKYFFLSGALFRINGALNNIFGTLSRMQEPQRLTGSFFKIIDRKPMIIDRKKAQKLSKKQAPEIQFVNVSFSYPGKDKKVFDKLNLTIKSGEHVALVGENGAGKSTLIKLLLRFYQPDEGNILINGVNLKDVEIDSWYNQLSTLFQEFNHYPFSIKENIELTETNKSNNNKVEEAGKFAGVDKVVSKLKHSWETVLDSSFKKGTEPSGGQWQRVALARAFYRDANVLILDEPTSAIDAKAEYDIFNGIFDHYKNRSALIVSHRFSTVRRANRILVMDNGKIIEEGSHKKLTQIKGLYHELFTKQAEGYKD